MAASSIFSIPAPQPFDSLLSLSGRCAVVTGGSRGLGEAIVRRLAEAGAAIVLTGRGRAALQEVQSQVNATGGQALGVQADLSSLADSQKVIDQTMERFGRIDVLVNNAAVFPPSLFTEVSEEVWDQTVDADLKGAYFLAQFAAKEMISAGRRGRIINVLSTDAFRPTGVLSAYGAAKLGLWSATQAMAKELAEHQILVNAITPGATITEERIAKFKDGTFGLSEVPEDAVKTREKLLAAVPRILRNPIAIHLLSSLASSRLLTPGGAFARRLASMMPLGRPGYPDEIAKAVLFLASDMASYISGANLLVDGAQTLR